MREAIVLWGFFSAGCIATPEEIYEEEGAGLDDADLAADTADSADGVIAQPVTPAPVLAPDITLSSASEANNAVYGCGAQNMAVQVTEQNLGSDTMPVYWLQLRRGNLPVRGIQVPALGPGQRRTTTYNFGFYGGPCDCFPGQWNESYNLVADPANQIGELNETNNTSNSFNVRRRCP